jgi:ABC-type antimicrobial peptide transport system permease subunit
MRQLLTESALLALIGGVFGIVVPTAGFVSASLFRQKEAGGFRIWSRLESMAQFSPSH